MLSIFLDRTTNSYYVKHSCEPDPGPGAKIQGHHEVLYANAQGAGGLRHEYPRQIRRQALHSRVAREPLPEAGAPKLTAQHESLTQLPAHGSAERGGSSQEVDDDLTIESY